MTNKIYKTIGEVSKELSINTHTLRFWEKEFRQLKPKYIQIEYNWHHLFKNINLYYFSKFLKDYNTYKILPFSKKLLKINTERPEHNYFNYSNIVFIRKK